MRASSRRRAEHIGRPLVEFLQSEEIFTAGVILLASLFVIWAVLALGDAPQWLVGTTAVW